MAYKTIDVGSISFEDVVVHTLPKHKKNEVDKSPGFSERTSPLTITLKTFFKDKIVSSLTSDKAFKVSYDPSNTSPVPVLSKAVVNSKRKLVANSKMIAQHLFDSQNGSNNEGILVVIFCQVNKNPALVLIKLEMDTGAQLILDSTRKAYDIKEIQDLMLTQKTKVYKVGLLLDRGLQGVAYDGVLADHQVDMKAKEEVKSFFMNKFLGCIPFQDPKITTQNFYNYTKAYIDTISDDVQRAKYHQDLNSYMLKNSSTISPTEFADDYFAESEEKNNYRSYLLEKKFGFESFTKDTTQVERRIRKIIMEFTNGIVLTSENGTFENKVKLETLENGQTKAEIISKVRKIK